MRRRYRRMPDYKTGVLLRELLRDGIVELKNGGWIATSRRTPLSPNSSEPMPALSKETLSLLGLDSANLFRTNHENTVAWPEGGHGPPEATSSSGRWETFRKLVAYYRQCIRNEEGADASAYQNQLGNRFIYLRKFGSWYPRPGMFWRSSVSIREQLSPLANSLPGPADDQSLIIGYPVHAFYIKKEDEPDVALIRPIFFFSVEYSISNNGLVITCESPRAEINLGWLEKSFPSKLDSQRNFLSACGFINRFRPNDEVPGNERGEISPGLENLVATLSAFMPQRIRQPLAFSSVPDHPIQEPFETGIYNRAVLMIANKTRYNAMLLKELGAIEKAPEDVLNRTALRHIFANGGTTDPSKMENLVHEGIVADITLLNAEQRKATASLLKRTTTVITGPPGTGKSQVVSCAALNARIYGQTVLFASRNHKAIDAVIERMVDSQGRFLMVRTNSKEDPNLKFTFDKAIKLILAEQKNIAAVHKLERTKRELNFLLNNRGIEAGYAHQAAEVGNELGEIEEKAAWLANKIPPDMILFLDANPERFPEKSFQRLVLTGHAMNNQRGNRYMISRFTDMLRAFSICPWYLSIRRKLKRFPGAPEIPSIPTPAGLRKMLPKISMLELASEYAGYRRQCRPLEDKLAELPPIEATTETIAGLTNRIKKIAADIVIQDIDARHGLAPGADREKLGGLKGALKAMRTGLDEGIIRSETIRVLSESIPPILESLPCWAVTNLSAGSRIPFVPGMFDLAIIDEASQSDIPSAIPILYRARRVGVVGDPWQLSHTSKISTAKDTMLRRQVGLDRVEDVRFAYTESSLYDLCAGTRGVETVFLSETYRSAKNIADYSNLTYYNGRLRVATNHKRLVVPAGMFHGIHWSNVSGEIKSGGGSGCYCGEEIDEVVKIVRTMLLENKYKGTLGIVTPFRQQANRLKDALFESDIRLYDSLDRAKAHVDTAHGFQGDERDVILFSLCAGPGMPHGSKSFLRESGNLFNVAASRAKAVLHVIGNRNWAIRCGIRHIEQLAVDRKESSSARHRGPWHPHESPWEENFYNALVNAGLKPRAQYSVSSRRLDLALVRQGDNPLKIDIEVDGDTYHRNPDGSRKMDDHWRDIQLQGLGWKVMRFWTYQLREDMVGCVEKVVKEWRKNE